MGKRGPVPGTMRGPGVRGSGLPARIRVPEEVRADADMLAAWREWFPLLRDRLVREDLPAFVDMLRCYARVLQAERLVADEGLIGTGRAGEPVRAIAVVVAKQYRADFRAYADRFGLHPAGRGRLPAQQEGAAGVEASLADVLFTAARERAALEDDDDEWRA